jgi:hypothetical protein
MKKSWMCVAMLAVAAALVLGAGRAEAGVFYFEFDENGTDAYDSYNGSIFKGGYWKLKRVGGSRSANEAVDEIPNPETGKTFSHPVSTDGATDNDSSVLDPRFYAETSEFQMRNVRWTFEGWFQNDTQGNLPGWDPSDQYPSRQTIAATRSGLNGDSYGWYLTMWGNRHLRVLINSTAGETTLISTDTFADTAFHHFALTWDPNDGTNGRVKLFIDGALQGSVEGRGQPLYDDDDGYTSRYFTVGVEEGGTAENFAHNQWDGRLDEFRYTSGGDAAVETWQFLNGSGEPPVVQAPIAEPASIGLLGLALLGLRKRRS